MKKRRAQRLSQRDKVLLSELIGEKIRLYRLREGMTQTKLANRLELSYQQVQKYEQGKNRISIEHLWSIAYILSRSLFDFIPDQLNEKAMDMKTLKKEEALLRLYRSLNDIERKGVFTLCQTLSKNHHDS